MNPKTFEATIDQARVVAAIQAAERRTSGELRVVVSRSPAEDALAAAEREFARLGMTATRERNAVLIFVAPRSQTFAIVGDEGIHRRCGEGFWDEVAGAMAEAFRRGDFTGGLVQAIERAGALLATQFPRRGDDRNELSDTVEER